MKKTEQATRVKSVCAYLAGIGAPVSTVQGYEVLARSLGYKNKHVLSSAAESDEAVPFAAAPNLTNAKLPKTVEIDGETIGVMALTDEPFSVTKMRELGWSFDVIVPFALDQLENIDMMNDYASTRITGKDYALEGIGYDHVPAIAYGKGWVAYRVTGDVSSPSDIFGEDADDEEASFYADLLELANAIKGNVMFDFEWKGQRSSQVVWRVHASSHEMLRQYALSKGANNDQLIQHKAELVFECHAPRGKPDVTVSFALGDLKYATKPSPHTWAFDCRGHTAQLTFDAS